MKIEIVTKFNIGDEVIGYVSKRGFRKFKVEDIRVQTRSIDYTGEDIEYLCSIIADSNLKCQETFTFTQSELFSSDGLRDCVNKFLTFPVTSEQAKYDIDMYSEIKDLIQRIQHCIPVAYPSDNVRWIKYVKWLESKFPEIEQFVKINKNIR